MGSEEKPEENGHLPGFACSMVDQQIADLQARNAEDLEMLEETVDLGAQQAEEFDKKIKELKQRNVELNKANEDLQSNLSFQGQESGRMIIDLEQRNAELMKLADYWADKFSDVTKEKEAYRESYAEELLHHYINVRDMKDALEFAAAIVSRRLLAEQKEIK